MKIGIVSKELGIPASTIRYYESEGLIGPVSRNAGMREFNEQTLFTLRFVKLAQAAGFSIDEMKFLLERHQHDSNPANIWRSLATARRESIAEQIRDLQRKDEILGKLISCNCDTLNQCVEIALNG